MSNVVGRKYWIHEISELIASTHHTKRERNNHKRTQWQKIIEIERLFNFYFNLLLSQISILLLVLSSKSSSYNSLTEGWTRPLLSLHPSETDRVQTKLLLQLKILKNSYLNSTYEYFNYKQGTIGFCPICSRWPLRLPFVKTVFTPLRCEKTTFFVLCFLFYLGKP